MNENEAAGLAAVIVVWGNRAEDDLRYELSDHVQITQTDSFQAVVNGYRNDLCGQNSTNIMTNGDDQPGA